MSRPAFTLLEVLIALAILIVGLAALAHLTNLAGRMSQQSFERSEIQVHVQTRMNLLLADMNTPISPVFNEPVAGMRHWYLDISITDIAITDTVLADTARPGLKAIHILARKTDGRGMTIDRYELVRWITTDRAQP